MEITAPASGSKAPLVVACAIHCLMLLMWVIVAAFAGSAIGEISETAGVVVFGTVLLVWAWLFTKLVSWWRKGQSYLWRYPIFWALVAGFPLSLLFPGVRRAMRPQGTTP